MDKIIILKPDDTYEVADYEGYMSISKAVDGHYELYRTVHIKFPFSAKDGYVELAFYCNEEGLLKNEEKYKKVNAIAKLLFPDGIASLSYDYGIVFGNVALVAHHLVKNDEYNCEEKDVRGLKDFESNDSATRFLCETNIIINEIRKCILFQKRNINIMHFLLDRKT